ncbi:MAG: hypothetical protein CVU05_06500 [Bacteroidetes bacterium HGW-Bacteroidetes-21]|jgi:hypothetical protein|nr:MAG: hypothetical protein CVU05_06500 [Bacteroidetes bacterium HGW-Bacteroidetes-21]
MAFSEKVKYEVKRLSHQSCCVCKKNGIEIHHIVPQSENGDDSIDNAAPLCPSCHEIYGLNPSKRKFIRESRDIWFEICSKRYSNDDSKLNEILSKVNNIEKYVSESKNVNSSLIKISFGQFIDFLNRNKFPKKSCENQNISTFFALVFETKGGNNEDSKKFNSFRDFFLSTFGRLLAEKLIIYLINVSST